MEYSAWKNIDGLVLTAKFTPDDLKDPIIYNANDLIKYILINIQTIYFYFIQIITKLPYK